MKKTKKKLKKKVQLDKPKYARRGFDVNLKIYNKFSARSREMGMWSKNLLEKAMSWAINASDKEIRKMK